MRSLGCRLLASLAHRARKEKRRVGRREAPACAGGDRGKAKLRHRARATSPGAASVRREAPACAGVTGGKPRPRHRARGTSPGGARLPARRRGGGHSALTICHRQIVRARLIPPGRSHFDLASRTTIGCGGAIKCPNPALRSARPRPVAALRALPRPRVPRPVMPAKAGIPGEGGMSPAGETGHGRSSRSRPAAVFPDRGKGAKGAGFLCLRPALRGDGRSGGRPPLARG
jgi:hypothetical protein